MKLLVSTYACSPHHGSEHAVGWNYATEAHKLGHEVWVLASSVHREAIERACEKDPALAGITWLFPEVAWWKLTPGVEPRRERTYNLLWQIAARRMALDLHRTIGFDVVHHLTWGGLRAPTFLAALGVPLIIGPIGGGETSPVTLRDELRPRARVTEFIRDVSNRTITCNLLVRGGLDKASMIFVKTPDTAKPLTKSMQAKTVQFLELGIAEADIGQPRTQLGSGLRVLFVGRLIYWKGAHIALRAFTKLLLLDPGARLTIIGKGPELTSLKADARHFGVQRMVDFIPWLPREELTSFYDQSDVFLFPSLHDSSGAVVLEAMARGLPVVCLDTGGPAHIVTPQSGIVVRTRGRNTAEVAGALAGALAILHGDDSRFAALSSGAIARARSFILAGRVAEFYGRVGRSVAAGGGTVPRRACRLDVASAAKPSGSPPEVLLSEPGHVCSDLSTLSNAGPARPSREAQHEGAGLAATTGDI